MLRKLNFALYDLGGHLGREVIYLISILERVKNGLEQGMAKVFETKYFQLCGSHGLQLDTVIVAQKQQ